MDTSVRKKLLLTAAMGAAAVGLLVLRGALIPPARWSYALQASPLALFHGTGLAGALILLVSVLGLARTMPTVSAGRAILLLSAAAVVSRLIPLFKQLGMASVSADWTYWGMTLVVFVPYLVSIRASLDLILKQDT